jgi:hypothetical protein
LQGARSETFLVKGLPAQISQYQRYQNALKQCVEASEAPSQSASQTIQLLQKRMNVRSQCITEYKRGEAEALRAKATDD